MKRATVPATVESAAYFVTYFAQRGRCFGFTWEDRATNTYVSKLYRQPEAREPAQRAEQVEGHRASAFEIERRDKTYLVEVFDEGPTTNKYHIVVKAAEDPDDQDYLTI